MTKIITDLVYFSIEVYGTFSFLEPAATSYLDCDGGGVTQFSSPIHSMFLKLTSFQISYLMPTILILHLSVCMGAQEKQLSIKS